MRVNPSAAEIKLAAALQDAGVKGWLKDERVILKSTVPDFWFGEKKVAVYLDGEEVHSGIKAEARDDRITEALEKRGVRVLRFRYSPPLSRKRLNEIIAAIQEALL